MSQGGLDLTGYPPAPVVWVYNAVDTACEPLGCGNWRAVLPASWTQGWLSDSFRMVKPVSALLPPLTSYTDFRNGETPSFASLYQFAFETPTTTLADLTSPSSLLMLIALLFMLRLIKRLLLPYFSECGRTAARRSHGTTWEQKPENAIRIVKFGEYVFRLIFHSFISAAGIYYFWDKEWWKPGGTVTLFRDYPHQDIQPGMIWYYLIQAAYNLDAMISLLEMSLCLQRTSGMLPRLTWSSDCRGDFREMFIHHVVTNLLVIGSSFFRFTRVGSMVFLVHDLSDVPVDLSKLANFLKWKMATILCFASMVIVWCMTRLGVLPFVIYKSVLYETWWVCQSGVIDPIFYVYYKPIFVVLIGMLIILHLAWFTMFIQMGWVLVSKGEAHDLSEHKKGEHHHHSSSSPKKKKVS